ncbi:carnitine O-acetyltransferase-like, partial [Saccoglossus kowalevskii]|uniref:Carnitine O-acetyltransferase-like n=1 Tax=Saccoglossus kowalevskii TaxID=10224 RepID=A0ABM0MPW9_SACKO
LIVGRDGNCGLQYEHAPAEGPPIMALISHILDFIKTINEPIKPSTNVLPLPKELVLKLDNDLLQDINIAKDNLDVLVNDVTVCCFQFKPFGKNFPKKNRMSPDAFIQVALQLAYYKIYKRTAATYESASLRRFRLGRTDTIRSCTNASLRFCKAMLDSNKTPSERYHLLRAAVEAHKTYTNQALVGEVIDRHLLGLKLTAIESGQNVPEIFMDPAYQTAMHFKISTSQVPSTYDLIMCFGPVVPDGYGVCYNPHEEKFNFSLTSFNSSPETNANKLAKTLADSLLEMQSLTVQNEGSKL